MISLSYGRPHFLGSKIDVVLIKVACVRPVDATSLLSTVHQTFGRLLFSALHQSTLLT